MKLGDLIRKPLEVLPPTASCANAASLMRDRRVGSVVLVEQGRPLGIVTDRDLVTRVMAMGYDPAQLAVREIMTAFPIYLSTSQTTSDAVRTMCEMAVRRIPVVDAAGALVGMIAMDDLIAHLGSQLHALGTAIDEELGVDREAHVA